MRIAVIQLGYDDDEAVADRVGRVADLVRAQAGHDLVVLPELWAPGGFAYKRWEERAEPVDGMVASAMSAAARDAGVMLHAGSIVERPADGAPGSEGKSSGDSEGMSSGGESSEGKNRWNTSLVFAADGSLVTTYRKIHRFGFGRGEPLVMEAGQALALVDVPDSSTAGGVARAGLSTCYDLRFPELYRAQLDAGATLFVIPAAWPAARVRHWTLLAHARAIENQCVVVACNTAGTHAGVEMGGHSQVVLPTGDVAAVAGADEQVLSVEVDMAVVDDYRSSFPVLRDRRLPLVQAGPPDRSVT
jgi:predicted amidohydrolase